MSTGSSAVSSEPLPLVLLAGRMTAPYAWHYQHDHFAKSRRVIMPDRHFGLPSIRSMAETIAEDLPSYFDLVGWSMGGYIAFELLDLLTDRIAHLCLVSTTARPEPPGSASARRAEVMAVEIEGISDRWIADKITASVWSDTLEPMFFAQLCAANAQFGSSVFRKQTEAIIDRRDARPLLGAITCPTAVIAGARDTVIPLEHTREIARAIAGCSFHEIADAGHCAPYETPGDVTRILDILFSQ